MLFLLNKNFTSECSTLAWEPSFLHFPFKHFIQLRICPFLGTRQKKTFSLSSKNDFLKHKAILFHPVIGSVAGAGISPRWCYIEGRKITIMIFRCVEWHSFFGLYLLIGNKAIRWLHGLPLVVFYATLNPLFMNYSIVSWGFKFDLLDLASSALIQSSPYVWERAVVTEEGLTWIDLS